MGDRCGVPLSSGPSGAGRSPAQQPKERDANRSKQATCSMSTSSVIPSGCHLPLEGEGAVLRALPKQRDANRINQAACCMSTSSVTASPCHLPLEGEGAVLRALPKQHDADCINQAACCTSTSSVTAAPCPLPVEGGRCIGAPRPCATRQCRKPGFLLHLSREKIGKPAKKCEKWTFWPVQPFAQNEFL